MVEPDWVIDGRKYLYKHWYDPWIWEFHTESTDKHGDSITLPVGNVQLPPTEAALIIDTAAIDGISLDEFAARALVNTARIRHEQMKVMFQLVDEEDDLSKLEVTAENMRNMAREELAKIRPEYLYLLPSL